MDNLDLSETEHSAPPNITNGLRWFGWVIQVFFTLAIPIILTLLSARLVMTETFLKFEYHLPGFPEDRYGFTIEDRLTYAPITLNYLINNEPLSYLGDLQFADGAPVYEQSELHHMDDVQRLTRYAFMLLAALTIVSVLLFSTLLITKSTVPHFLYGLTNGSLLTLGIIGVIVILAIVAWDTFFTGFHQIFFESGTWRFYYSDTLIRLFPERFWFDAAIAVGGFTTLTACCILFSTWQWRKRYYNQ